MARFAGITHTGVVTFHELAPRLTRIEVNVDFDSGSLIAKAPRGMRHVKRAVRADLHTSRLTSRCRSGRRVPGAAVIEDGELVEDHDPGYDEEREYGQVESPASDEASEGDEVQEGEDEGPEVSAEQEAADEEADEDKETQRQRLRRFERQARASASGSQP